MSWQANIELRVTHLGVRHHQICQALGVSAQGWYGMRTAQNPTLRTMKIVGAALAIPHHLLIGGSPSDMVTAPIPQWDWLGWLKAETSLGLQGSEISYDLLKEKSAEIGMLFEVQR